ncbi:polysaccharide biosynthesis/export family protein [Pararhizobium sp. PWRC1-1]|uniref:polysaccharide biosynthesis/export family protein n=1 Tax=Pararhizobium sp. PWRC1-1 TaxID=2804566 RepID=UPI003CF4F521
MTAFFRRYCELCPALPVLFAASIFGGLFTPALADGSQLTPQTRFRLTIVQWMPTKGAYERWDALGGEFRISQTGTVTLPVVGTLPVGGLDNAGLATEVAKRLKAKIGLVETPETTVEILEQPPVYVVGNVNAPGEYKFHPGITVLQSLAMSGGEFRPLNGTQNSVDKTGYVGQLQEIANATLRSEIKIVRLQAEISGAKEMRPDMVPQDDPGLASAIFQQEQVIHTARLNDLDRQSKSYGELRNLLTSEIDVIEKKIIGADEDIVSIQKELSNVKAMVERGIALPTRQSDLERTLRSYHANRLDLVTSIMRARQNIAEATRNLDGLSDKQHTEVASELQAEQATLDQLKLKRDTTQKMLLSALSAGAGSQAGEEPLAFTVTRQVEGIAKEIAAAETTVLQPGDVVRVLRQKPPVSNASAASTSLPVDGNAQAEQASQ